MRMDITAQIGAASKEVKGLEVLTAKHLKTRTDVSFTVEGKDLTCAMDAVADIKLLKLEGASVQSIMVTVEGARCIGTMINRSTEAIRRLHLSFGDEDEPMDWRDESGVFTVESTKQVPINGADIPFILELIHRIVKRGSTKVPSTHHPFTLYDLKQATQIVHGINTGDDVAKELDDWMAPRELIYLEEQKKAKAKVAAAKKEKTKKAKEESAAKAKAKKDEAKAKGKEKTTGKTKEAKKGKSSGKAKAKGGSKSTANLGDMKE